MALPERMHIIHIATELAQVAKVGGLGDVIYGLSKAQVKEGHRVEIILPKYDCIQWNHLNNLTVAHRDLWVAEGSQRFNNTIWKATHDNLSLFLIDPHHPHYYFTRGIIYGAHDDIDSFAYFSKAACEFLFQMQLRPHILHLHDWPTSLVAPLYKDLYSKEGMRAGALVLTIHNLQYQGKSSPFHLSRIVFNGSHYHHPERMQDPFQPLLVNLLKGGIVYADGVTTVSPTFEKESKTPLGGFGLHEILCKHKNKFRGILNGIDENFWNPQTDPYLKKNYAVSSSLSDKEFAAVLAGKEENRKELCKRCSLSHQKKTLLGSITRLVSQKDPKLILQAIERTLEKGGQYILLGSQPEEEVMKALATLKKTYPKSQLSLNFEQDEELAHLIYAGAHLFVIPSLFEPCGLTQMIAMRYGSIPIVRKTGGLADTVFDIDPSDAPLSERNGFSFDFPDREGVHWALDRALTCQETDPQKWHLLIRHALAHDFSWKQATPQYLSIYQELLKPA